jgi:hypothetical protein
MLRINEEGEMMEKMLVMEGISEGQAQLLYGMYRYIYDDVKAGDFPEGKEVVLVCGDYVEVMDTTPWLLENVSKKGYVLITNENYALVGFTKGTVKEGETMNLKEMGYAMYRNEDLKVIPEIKTEE